MNENLLYNGVNLLSFRFSLRIKFQSVATEIRALWQYNPVVLFNMLCNMVVTIRLCH